MRAKHERRKSQRPLGGCSAVELAELDETQRLGVARAHDVRQYHVIARLLSGDVHSGDAIIELIGNRTT